MIKAHRTRTRLIAAVGTALTILCAGLTASAPPASAANYVAIAGSGSTWSYNAIHSWITNVAQYGMTVNYTENGSTSGRSQFKQGTVDWAASEIPYGVQDGTDYDPPPTTRGYAYMPDTAGGTTFMYNLTIGNQRVTDLRLSGKTIADIFTNKITMWNDPEIVADNPGLTMPAIRIVPVVRADGSGATAEFTQWMIATQGSDWTAYCAAVGRNPCTQTSAYPVQPGTAMVGQQGDLGVSGYVSQQQADGAIGYVEFSYALETGFPVAKVLNAAGYYTEPTPGHVAVSLLQAQLNNDQNSPLYLTQNLSGVYTDTDPRTYELSSYSYMILPTDSNFGLSAAKGNTLAAYGSYLLCQGQQQVDQLGYSALPINLVKDGYAQLARIPGNQVPSVTSSFIQGCNNPTFSTDGTNTLANNDPQPAACDKQGPTQCTASTGGAQGSGGANGSTNNASASNGGTTTTPATSGSTGTHGATSPGTSNTAGNGAHPGSTGTAGSSGAPGTAGSSSAPGTAGSSSAPGTAGSSSAASCDPNTGTCSAGGGSPTTANGVPVSSAAGTAGSGTVNGMPVAAPSGLGNGAQIALMALAAALLVGVGLVPPLVSQGTTRRRRRGPPPPYNPTDYP